MNEDEYVEYLGNATVAKLRATATLAEYPERRFDAAVFFHEAERLTRRAKAFLAPGSFDSVVNDVERCYLFLEGFDPWGAKEVWDHMQPRIGAVANFRDLAIRIVKRVPRESQEAIVSLRTAKTLLRTARSGTVIPKTAADRHLAVGEIQRLLERHPGVKSYWWMAYRLSTAVDDQDAAWNALSRGELLDPESGSFRAMRLVLGPQYLSEIEARTFLDDAGKSLDDAPAVVALHYALAELGFDRASATSPSLERAARVLDAAEGQPQSTKMRNYLRVAREILARRKAHKPLTRDMLSPAGLQLGEGGEFSETTILKKLVERAAEEVGVPMPMAMAA